MSKFFINRPIVAIVIAILTVIVGAVAVAGLPVAQFPQIAPPEIQVTAIYVGADAQTIEQSVATPIEQQMSGVDNMNYMYSLNATANGQMRMIVDFDVATDPEYGSDSGAKPRDAGRVAASRGRHQLRRHGSEIGAGAAHAGGAVLAQGHARCEVPGQLRLHQSERSADSREGRRHGSDLRLRASTPCASG